MSLYGRRCPRVIVVCDWCKKEFLIKPSRKSKLKNQKNVFCSRECCWAFKGRNKVKKSCIYCGEEFIVPPSLSAAMFCSRTCRTTERNLLDNPAKRLEARIKIRESRLGPGNGRTYEKTFGVHTHRVLAEKRLGRKLLPGEIIHHIDGNRRNNSLDNLMVFNSQGDHVVWHARKRKEGGS